MITRAFRLAVFLGLAISSCEAATDAPASGTPLPILSTPVPSSAPAATPMQGRRVQERVFSFASAPPLEPHLAWTAHETLPEEWKAAELDTHSFCLEQGILWSYAQKFGPKFHGEACALVKISLPGFKTEVWPLPEELSAGDGEPVQLEVDADFILIAKAGSCFGVYDRKTEEWTIHREFHFFDKFIRYGRTAYFFAPLQSREHPFSREVLGCDLDTGKTVTLASNLRTPPQSPLDGPEVQMFGLEAAPDGTGLRIRACDTPPWGVDSQPQNERTVTFNCATQVWTIGPKLTYVIPPDGVLHLAFTPITAPGNAAHTVHGDLLGLQLPFPRTAYAAFHVTYPASEPRSVFAKDTDNPSSGVWYWTPTGYLVAPGRHSPFLWLLPEADLEKFVATNTPVRDSSLTRMAAPVHQVFPVKAAEK